MIAFRCPACDAAIRVADDRAGTSGQCKKCGKKIRVPDAAKEEIEQGLEPEPPQPPPPPIPTAHGAQSSGAQSGAWSNSIGISSMVTGLLALISFCLPIVGAAFAAVTLLLALFGLISSRRRKWEGVGYPITGLTLGLFGLVASTLMATMYVGSFFAYRSVLDRNRAKSVPEAIGGAQPNDSPPQGADPMMELPKAAAEQNRAPSLRRPTGPLKTYDASERPFMVGKLRIGVKAQVSPDFSIALTIQNMDDEHRLNYHGSFQDDARSQLTDDKGNAYEHLYPLNLLIQGAGVSGTRQLDPSEVVKDLFYFEKPIPKTKVLLLRMDCFDELDPFIIRIPSSMVKKTSG